MRALPELANSTTLGRLRSELPRVLRETREVNPDKGARRSDARNDHPLFGSPRPSADPGLSEGDQVGCALSASEQQISERLLPQTISLTLPYPVSANVYWRSFVPRGHSRAIVTLSDEAKAYKQTVGWKVKAAGIRRPISGRVCIEIQLYPQRPLDAAKRIRNNPMGWDDDVRCIDLDNANKVLLDSLKGLAIEDDKWVRKIVSERMEPDGEARVIVTIRPIITETPQASLL